MLCPFYGQGHRGVVKDMLLYEGNEGSTSHFTHGAGGVGTKDYIFSCRLWKSHGLHSSSAHPIFAHKNQHRDCSKRGFWDPRPYVEIQQVWSKARLWHFKQASQAELKVLATLHETSRV